MCAKIYVTNYLLNSMIKDFMKFLIYKGRILILISVPYIIINVPKVKDLSHTII